MYYSVICRGERVEFHIYGGIHISGLVSDKKMGISLECAEYAYIVGGVNYGHVSFLSSLKKLLWIV